MALDTNKWSKASLDTKQMKKGQGWIQNKARGKFGYKTNEALGVCCDTNMMASGHSNEEPDSSEKTWPFLLGSY